MKSKIVGRRSGYLAIGLLQVFVLLAQLTHDAPRAMAADKSLTEQTKEAVNDTTEKVSKAVEDWWERIDEARLKNRTPDQIVAWVIIGLLVGSLAGMLTKLRPTGLGQVGRIFLGLAGAAIGGIIAQLANLDFGWGPVLISYEEVFFSLLGALALVIIGKLIKSKSGKKSPS